jgi:hypothetical protein
MSILIGQGDHRVVVGAPRSRCPRRDGASRDWGNPLTAPGTPARTHRRTYTPSREVPAASSWLEKWENGVGKNGVEEEWHFQKRKTRCDWGLRIRTIATWHPAVLAFL